MIVFEAPHFKLYWHEGSPQYVQTEWHGFVGKEKIEKGLTRALKLVKEKHATLWLSDLRDMHVFSEEAQKWLLENFYPQMVKAGIKKLAFVKPQLIVTYLSLQRVVSNYDLHSLQFDFFDTIEAAEEWLKQ